MLLTNSVDELNKGNIDNDSKEPKTFEIDQEAIENYDFSEKSKNYYRPPIPSYKPPPPPPHHPTTHHFQGYKPFYGVDFTPILVSLLPMFLVMGTIFGLALTKFHSEDDTVYLANYSAPIVTVNVNSSSDSDSASTSSVTSTDNDTVILGFIYPNGTLENVTVLIPTLGGLSGIGNILNLGGIFLG